MASLHRVAKLTLDEKIAFTGLVITLMLSENLVLLATSRDVLLIN